MTVSVVIPTTRPSVDELIVSLQWGRHVPDEIIVVTNEVKPTVSGVTVVGFDSTEQPYGSGDAGLRRDIGADVATGDILVFIDDDCIAPIDLVEKAVEITERDGLCWGHHRYIDFEQYTPADLLEMDPSMGRSRETEANRWHGWQSSYAGNFTIRRDQFWDVGGFDLAFLGHHGSEDQQLGYRLGGEERKTYVHEPPFAWHPETDRFHSRPASNIMGAHKLVQQTINGFEFLTCEECPCRRPLNVLGLAMSEQAVIRFSREQFTLSKERI